MPVPKSLLNSLMSRFQVAPPKVSTPPPWNREPEKKFPFPLSYMQSTTSGKIKFEHYQLKRKTDLGEMENKEKMEKTNKKAVKNWRKGIQEIRRMKEKETGSEWKREKSRTSKEEERSVSEGEKKQAACSHLLLVEDLVSPSVALFALWPSVKEILGGFASPSCEPSDSGPIKRRQRARAQPGKGEEAIANTVGQILRTKYVSIVRDIKGRLAWYLFPM